MDEARVRKDVLEVDEYRARCLWFLREDYYPSDTQSMLRALSYMQRYGDREAYHKVQGLRRWLSQNSNELSAIS